ncbi:glycosyltransferase family A protein [Cellulomonas bogoriensis]|uniref:Glycosyltransferase 2-like domain-containing protein n=1 Tax=Cellulomonas bogoriensis 69B4 = DSM 16987 TaxID=1386082 RepID=A0A0A0BXV7_9CELL|nr:glycosyltransferase family A protein [Cellulomonas bogoriensis]KGM12024.1 hypothetical protein N869_02140 [Cellulomonas bogoriensis 69B4 = DSM 16987]
MTSTSAPVPLPPTHVTRRHLARPEDPRSLGRTVLRNRARAGRDLLALGATGDRHTFDGLLPLLSRPRQHDLRWPWLIPLARVLALQPAREDDLATALRILETAPAKFVDVEARSLHGHLLAATGDRRGLERLARTFPDEVEDLDAIRANLLNPHLRADGDPTLWAAALEKVFAVRGLVDTRIGDPTAPSPLETLTGPTRAAVDGPKVTVITTTFRPGPSLLTAVGSILAQSWHNLEVLVVDDCSGPEHQEVLEQVAALDERVRVLRQEVNGGTYRARNLGLEHATGEFVTGHDDDDWAHPDRIARQAQVLLESPRVPATLSNAVRASDVLEVAPLGRSATGTYAPSYMVRRELAERAGRYHPGARKAADNELVRRVEAMTGERTVLVTEALSVYHNRVGSLSKADFAPGWVHPARLAFWALSRTTLGRVARGALEAHQAVARTAVPQRLSSDPRTSRSYDVLVVADWSRGAEAQALVPELRALTDAGHRVGVTHVEDVRYAGPRRRPLEPRMLTMANAGDVDVVMLDDVAHVATALVRSPGAFEVPPDVDRTIEIDRVVMLLDTVAAPGARGPQAIDPVGCHRAATALLGTEPTWLTPSADVRHALLAAMPADLHDRVHGTDVGGVVDQELLAAPRPDRLHGPATLGLRVPVGDHAELDRVAAHLTDVQDVRCIGAVESWRTVESTDRWVRYEDRELPAEVFLAQVDVLAHPWKGTGVPRSLRAAIAAGCIALVDPALEPVLGPAARYAAPQDVAAELLAIQDERWEYAQNVRSARAHLSATCTGPGFVADLQEAGVLT